ncbi:MAG: hypothetical protein HYW48_08205 [Deltaproteobacteria bacterium]|nr:hypothetical protein [Deltaproteobacteria bacterium]
MEEPAAQFPPNHLLATSPVFLEEPAAQFPPNHLLATKGCHKKRILSHEEITRKDNWDILLFFHLMRRAAYVSFILW